MTQPTLNILFSVAFLTTLWYLIECVIFTRRLETKNRTEWEAMGRPSLWDIRAQGPLLAILLGTSSLGPIQDDYRQQLLRIRVLLATAFSLMVVVAIGTA